MRIYRVKNGDKIVTVKRVKVTSLDSQYISSHNNNINENDEVFIRCSKKGKPKYYNKQHIVYPLSLPVIEVIQYDSPIVRFFKRFIPIIT